MGCVFKVMSVTFLHSMKHKRTLFLFYAYNFKSFSQSKAFVKSVKGRNINFLHICEDYRGIPTVCKPKSQPLQVCKVYHCTSCLFLFLNNKESTQSQHKNFKINTFFAIIATMYIIYVDNYLV